MKSIFGFLIGTTPCDRVAGLLDSYAQGHLATGESHRVELHIAECEPCRKELKLIDGVVSLVERLERPSPPPDLWQRVKVEITLPAGTGKGTSFLDRLRLPALAAGNGPSWRWIGPAAATVAAAAVIGISAFWPQQAINSGISPPVPVATHTEAISYADQAQEASVFDPLTDKASLGTIVNVAAPLGPANLPGHSQFHIDNAMAGPAGEGVSVR